jgi:hypothetical protein
MWLAAQPLLLHLAPAGQATIHQNLDFYAPVLRAALCALRELTVIATSGSA